MTASSLQECFYFSQLLPFTGRYGTRGRSEARQDAENTWFKAKRFDDDDGQIMSAYVWSIKEFA